MSDTAPHAARFQLHMRLFAEGSDYNIEDSTGRTAYHIDARKFRLRAPLQISDTEGRVTALIQQKLLSLHKHFVVESAGLQATMRREQHTQHNERFVIALADGTTLFGQGDFLRHEYSILRGPKHHRTGIDCVVQRGHDLRHRNRDHGISGFAAGACDRDRRCDR